MATIDSLKTSAINDLVDQVLNKNRLRDYYNPITGILGTRVLSQPITMDDSVPAAFSNTNATISRWDDLSSHRWLTGTPVAIGGDPTAGAQTITTGCTQTEPQMESIIYTGKQLMIEVLNFGANCVTVYIDNKLAFKGYPTTAAAYFIDIIFASFSTHQIDIHYGLASPLYLWFHLGDTLRPGPRRLNVGLGGDSYFESLGGGTMPDYGAMGLCLFEETGFAFPALAQGSTGWVNQNDAVNVSKQNYIGNTRIAAAKALSLDLMIIGGSINDAQNEAQVSANVAYLHQQLAPIPIITLGVEKFDNGSVGYAANNAAVISSAAAQKNSLGTIDWYNANWQNGTGSTAAPVGDGNQDFIIGSDNVHPNILGYKHFAKLIANAMGTFVYKRS